jgi:hypothetical protein
MLINGFHIISKKRQKGRKDRRLDLDHRFPKEKRRYGYKMVNIDMFCSFTEKNSDQMANQSVSQRVEYIVLQAEVY